VRKENPEKKVQGIVLTLNELSTDMNDFEVVKYDTFLHHVKKELGVNLANANYKYIYLLLDVMENMKNLKEGNKVDEKLVSFISKNESKIKDFVGDLKKYQAELRRTVNEVNNLVEEEVNGVKVKKWATRNINELYDIAVVDIELVNNVRIAIDSVIDHNGWRHEVFQRERGYNSDSFNLEQYCNERNIKVESINGRKHILSEKHPFNTGKQEIANKINSLLDRLTKGTYK
jgi:ribosomal protein L31